MKLTLELKKRIEALRNPRSLEEKYKGQFGVLSDVLGAEALSEALGASSYDKADLAELEALYIRTVSELERPAREAEAEAIEARLSAVSSVDLQKLAEVGRLLEKYR